VVGERRHGGDDGRLLTTAGGGGRDEDAGVLAPEGTALPLTSLFERVSKMSLVKRFQSMLTVLSQKALNWAGKLLVYWLDLNQCILA